MIEKREMRDGPQAVACNSRWIYRRWQPRAIQRPIQRSEKRRAIPEPQFRPRWLWCFPTFEASKLVWNSTKAEVPTEEMMRCCSLCPAPWYPIYPEMIRSEVKMRFVTSHEYRAEPSEQNMGQWVVIVTYGDRIRFQQRIL